MAINTFASASDLQYALELQTVNTTYGRAYFEERHEMTDGRVSPRYTRYKSYCWLYVQTAKMPKVFMQRFQT
ncbi:hypothetical protein INP83_12215 [Mucilaginibacter sp. 21P]|uniref:hypothetical protein n=1 Tax=Mucilaginibacter sp. 21P TaxID=2778902 RepID=UPI001C577934|nr:hypothetical protein [Mucilaginibacter sp. 21P]QXV63868.1 hypothetical protein INP83_12215 [Mucilaginibacter sp. 21P]